MMKKTILCSILFVSMLIQSFAQPVGVQKSMVEDVRNYFRKIGNDPKNQRGKILAQAEQKANECADEDCVYASYVDGIYDLYDDAGEKQPCAVDVKTLNGVWLNSSGYGYYEKISLSLYKGKPSVYQFITFKKTPSSIEDGFGGWDLVGCKIKTKEIKSSGGRIFIPGNELLIISYDESKNSMILLDGDYLVNFVRAN